MSAALQRMRLLARHARDVPCPHWQRWIARTFTTSFQPHVSSLCNSPSLNRSYRAPLCLSSPLHPSFSTSPPTSSPTPPAATLSSAEDFRALRSGSSPLSLSVLEVSGPTATVWLQNLTTADVTSVAPSHPTYSAFLNFKGRVVFDAFILSPPSANPPPSSSPPSSPSPPTSYWLLLSSSLLPTALDHLGKLNFRHKVRLTPRTVQAWAVLSSHPSHLSLAQLVSSSPDRLLVFIDPRASSLGAIFLSTSSLPPHFPVLPPELYHLHLTLHTIPSLSSFPIYHTLPPPLIPKPSSPSPSLPPPTPLPLPLELNLAELHAVAFNKGCYLGQEVTARAHFTGQLRKRLYSAMLVRESDGDGGVGGKEVRVGGGRLEERRDGEGLFGYRGVQWGWKGGDVVGQAVCVMGEDGKEKEVGVVHQQALNAVVAMLRVEWVERGERLWVKAKEEGERRWLLDHYEADWWPTQQQTAKEGGSHAVEADNKAVSAEQMHS